MQCNMFRMPKPNGEDNNKIPRDPLTKGLESAIQCTLATINNRTEKSNASTSKPSRPVVNSQSDGSIIKSQEPSGLKQKLVNKVKLWGTKGHGNSAKLDINLASISAELESLNITNITSDDAIYESDLIKAKSSMENLLASESKDNTLASGEVVNSKSCSYPTSSQGKEITSSDPTLGVNNNNSILTSRVWDPWNKLGRKNRKENKRRKREKTPTHSKEANGSPHKKSKDHTAGDEPRTCRVEPFNAESHNIVVGNEIENYEYQPFQHNKKSVKFINEVLVVYFTGDEVITKSIEPLKKELDQQIRNKEMRRGHMYHAL